MQPNQQYKVRAVFLNPLRQVIEQACFYKGQAIIFCYLASKSISQQSYDNAYLFLCVCVCVQLLAVNMDYSKLKKDRPDF